ncbi:DUF2844 domain-containing protein [Paraburkholderia hayleyella]|uniref:DUF2844 domain-containing protein n=1 Tax=Paraburkholderia hayleyella TaxID=2152889 RepID=UPI0012928EEA|nr:DUF2844 domain-containing protein [Paraburkholderia hayleyella]
MKMIHVAATVAMLLPLAAHATLGAAPSEIPHSTSTLKQHPAAKQLSAAQAVAPNAAYSVRQSQTSEGVTIREYVLPDNIVFALTWNGPIRPDMTQLLGSYFPNFAQASQAAAPGLGPLVGGAGDLKIESFAHPGSASGRAYLPKLVPAGVNVYDLP